jgi:hypothetical protein
VRALNRLVISASRRTDIPAFYLEWFMERIRAGVFKVVNPYNQKQKLIQATPDTIHTIVFWSKDYSRFINGRYGERLTEMGFHLFFNFTINSESEILEPNIPPLHHRLKQIKYLADHFDARAINWRFDPLCFFVESNGKAGNNLGDFTTIAEAVADLHITRCITSFMDHYQKIQKRLAEMDGFAFIDPPMERKKAIILKMKYVLDAKNIQLLLCCEKELLREVSENGVTGSSCIPSHLLSDLFGKGISLRKDTGQRVKDGCGCGVSVDIGSYREHPCRHNCLFCYANPLFDAPRIK